MSLGRFGQTSGRVEVVVETGGRAFPAVWLKQPGTMALVI